MANPQHLAILKQGRLKWNEWRRQNPTIVPLLQGAFVPGVNLRKVNLSAAQLEDADFHESDLRQAKFSKAFLSRANFSGADMMEADLAGCDVTEADFTQALLNRTRLQGARGSKAIFRRSEMSGSQLDAADLTNTDLRGADCRNASLANAILSGANLHSAILNRCDFTDADLTNCDLGNADLREATLTNASLVSCDLRKTDLSGSRPIRADLSDSQVGWTHFGSVDLTTVVGLESLTHAGPSSIAVDTLYASAAKIPEIFLRGVGVPENLIVFLSSLTADPIQFYSCFISYSMDNQDFATRLHADLQAKRVRCWFAPHDVRGGRKLHDQIDEAIRVYDRLLLILSDASMNSEWVKTEIANARQREIREHRQMLFPISLVPFEKICVWKAFDGDTGKDSAREIREYFIPDFSNWKDHDAYRNNFERLLRDLQAEDRKPASGD